MTILFKSWDTVKQDDKYFNMEAGTTDFHTNKEDENA